jgi:hypothetical protein
VAQQTFNQMVHKPVAARIDAVQPVSEPAEPAKSVQAREHAAALLRQMQAGGFAGWHVPSVRARDEFYGQVCQARGWQRLPWHGRNGVGRHLAVLCSGRPIVPDENGKPTRCYRVPAEVLPIAAARRA